MREFFASAFEVSIGSKVGMTSAYLAYAARCKARDRAAVTPEQFFEAMDQIAARTAFPVELVDGKPHLMNVQLTGVVGCWPDSMRLSSGSTHTD